MGELNTLEKHGVLLVGVLFGVHDVAAHRGHPGSHSSNNARLVGARNKKNSSLIHRLGRVTV